eukprot:scaffold16150_cov155-Skeletonema_menzelii.AAC.2
MTTYPDLLGIGPSCAAPTATVLPSVESENDPPNKSIGALPFFGWPFFLKNGVDVGLILAYEDGRKLGREDTVGSFSAAVLRPSGSPMANATPTI